jgi:hypothetical protein
VASRRAPSSPVGEFLADIDRLRVALREAGRQIRSRELLTHIAAVAEAWYRTYRSATSGFDVKAIDEIVDALRTASDRSPSTEGIRSRLTKLRALVVALRTRMIAAPPQPADAVTDASPSFAAIPDPLMQQILTKRWSECVACLGANAPLAATVMMGGMLESLFLARVNREPKKKAIFTAKAAPKDKQGKAYLLKDWGLGDYIAVAHELNWITQPGLAVSAILQDYRNYIHPQKELSKQVSLTPEDARMLWQVLKAIAVRLL